jgi:hypothetical protein
MKVINILLGLGLSLGLAGCLGDEVKDFIEGTYVNSAGGEFSIASDTLVLEQIDGNNYVVHRRTGYHLISEGKVGPKEHETEEWSCVYSQDTKTLTESRHGKIISFFPEKGALQVGRRVYEKIK